MPEVSQEFLDLTEGGGEMGRLIRAVDWSQSAVGPFEKWPQSLKTALSICLGTKFPMFVWWGKDLTVFYNDSYIPFTGLKHPKYLGRPAREQWAEIWEALRPLTEQVLETGRSTWAESMLLFMNRKGFLEETYFTFSYSPIRDESGGVGGIINPCQETTVGVLGERRLKSLHALGSYQTKSPQEAGESMAKTLGNNVYDTPFALIYIADSNAGTASLIGACGVKPGSALAANTLDLTEKSRNAWRIDSQNVNPERRDGLRSLFFADLPEKPFDEKPDSAYVLPMRLPNQEATVGFLILGISPRLSFDELYQEFFALVCRHIVTHIANVRALEEEKKRAEALAEIDRLKTDFFSNVSHEFRTPLTLMLGPLEGLLTDGGATIPEALRSSLEVIHRNALRLLKLVNTLLDFSQIEANRADAHYEPTDLASLTVQLASAFDTIITQAKMKLRIECQPLTKKAYIDKDMWEKIILNLLSNAFKYTLQGEITVLLKQVGENAELKVQDTGLGIPSEELPKLFQRFHKVKNSKGRTYEGTGIGLALVKELVELHGGHIRVESILGKGSSFIVSLPLGSQHLPQDRISETPKEFKSRSFAQVDFFIKEASHWQSQNSHLQTALTQDKTKKKHIVLADDNTDMREYITQLLSDHYQVTAVSNGHEAFAAIIQSPPDLVLTDIMMPVMDGTELLKKIRASEALRTTPVILLSARAGEEAKVSGIELGADDYLTKPFSALELHARVHTQLTLSDMRASILRELEFANQELEAFAYSVSHDLRAPLRAIGGFSQILMEEQKNMPTDAQFAVQRILINAKRMGDLIDDLLALSRFSRQSMKIQIVDVSALVRQTLEELSDTTQGRHVDIRQAQLPSCQADPILLKQVWINLLSNALKYSRKKDPAVIEIGVGTSEHPNEVIYYVKDNGVGFDMQYANKLFGVFQRLHSSEDFEGTGVGLAIVKRLVDRLGGRIWVDSQENQGTTFYFSLPKS